MTVANREQAPPHTDGGRLRAALVT
jgi:hypothetical protein